LWAYNLQGYPALVAKVSVASEYRCESNSLQVYQYLA